jgi:hypothetical protein
MSQMDELKTLLPAAQAKTLTVPEAGRRYFDLSRNASYEAARRGDIPVIRVGRLLRVPVGAMERKLDIQQEKQS